MDIDDIASMITEDPNVIIEVANSKHIIESFMLSESAGAVSPTDILKVMSKSGAKFVLIGGHAISGFTGRPRATKDVDVVSSDFNKIFTALNNAYDGLSVEEGTNTHHIRKDGEEFVDVIAPEGEFKFYGMLLKPSGSQKMGTSGLRIPNLEAALAAKFSAMLNGNRSLLSRRQDAVDFYAMAKNNERNINWKRLTKMGDEIFHGGGMELNRQAQLSIKDKPPEFNENGVLIFRLPGSAGLWAKSGIEGLSGL